VQGGAGVMGGKLVVLMILGLFVFCACSSVKDDFDRLQGVGKEYCSARNMQFKGLYSDSEGIYSLCYTVSPLKEYRFEVT